MQSSLRLRVGLLVGKRNDAGLYLKGSTPACVLCLVSCVSHVFARTSSTYN